MLNRALVSCKWLYMPRPIHTQQVMNWIRSITGKLYSNNNYTASLLESLLGMDKVWINRGLKNAVCAWKRLYQHQFHQVLEQMVPKRTTKWIQKMGHGNSQRKIETITVLHPPSPFQIKFCLSIEMKDNLHLGHSKELKSIPREHRLPQRQSIHRTAFVHCEGLCWFVLCRLQQLLHKDLSKSDCVTCAGYERDQHQLQTHAYSAKHHVVFY